MLDSMPPCGPALRVDALTSAHGGPFILTLGRGECVSVVGRSGSGKSVLLRLIADLDPHTGEVFLNGRARSAWAAPAWRRKVVYQAAEPAWWAPTAAAHFPPDDTHWVRELAQALGLESRLLDTEVARLSTGERQRMALVRSLACLPEVLLLDEPTAALDPGATMALEALLAQRVRDGMSVLFVTHSREQAARVASRVVEVRDRVIHPS